MNDGHYIFSFHIYNNSYNILKTNHDSVEYIINRNFDTTIDKIFNTVINTIISVIV